MKPEELIGLLKSRFQKPDTYTLLIAAAAILSLLALTAAYRLFSSSHEESELAGASGQRFIYNVATDKFVKGGTLPSTDTATEESEETKELTSPSTEEEKKEEKSTDVDKEAVPEEPRAAEATVPSEQPAETTPEMAEQPVISAPGSEKESANTSTKKAKIAVVITGVGISKSQSEGVVNLPSAISIAISPYSHFAEDIINSSKAAKRIYLVEVPAEPKDYPITDPGPYSLLCDNQLVENLSHLEWALARVQNAVGAVIPIEEKFSQCLNNARAVYQKLAEMKMSLLISTPSSDEMPDSVKSSGILAARGAVIIDSVIDGTAIDNSLAELEKAAQENGIAIGIARPYPISVKAVSKWAETLPDRGFQLVPISEAFQSQKQ